MANLALMSYDVLYEVYSPLSSRPAPYAVLTGSSAWLLPGGAVIGPELRQPPFEQSPLGVVVDQGQCAAVRVAGFVGATEPAQQLAPRRVQVAIVLEGQLINDAEARLGTVRLGHRDGPV